MNKPLIFSLMGSLFLLNSPWIQPAAADPLSPRYDAGAVLMYTIRDLEMRQNEPWRYRPMSRQDFEPPIPVEDLIRYEQRNVEASIRIDGVQINSVQINSVDTESQNVEDVQIEDTRIDDVRVEFQPITPLNIQNVDIQDVGLDDVTIE